MGKLGITEVTGAIGAFAGYLAVGGIGGAAVGCIGALAGKFIAGDKVKPVPIPMEEIFQRGVKAIKEQSTTLIYDGLMFLAYWGLSHNTRLQCNEVPNANYCRLMHNADLLLLTYGTGKASFLFQKVVAKIHAGPTPFEKLVDSGKKLGGTASNLVENVSQGKKQLGDLTDASQATSYEASGSSW